MLRKVNTAYGVHTAQGMLQTPKQKQLDRDHNQARQMSPRFRDLGTFLHLFALQSSFFSASCVWNFMFLVNQSSNRESQTRSSKRAFQELQSRRVQGNPLLTLCQPFANPLPTLCQPFANLFCQPLSKLLFLYAPITHLEKRGSMAFWLIGASHIISCSSSCFDHWALAFFVIVSFRRLLCDI